MSNDNTKGRAPLTRQAVVLSNRLGEIAQALGEILEETAGGDVSFVLIVQVGHYAELASNCELEDSRELLADWLARWGDASDPSRRRAGLSH